METHPPAATLATSTARIMILNPCGRAEFEMQFVTGEQILERPWPGGGPDRKDSDRGWALTREGL